LRAGYNSRNGIFTGGTTTSANAVWSIVRNAIDPRIPGLPKSSTKDLEDPTITAEDGETRSLLSVHAVDSDAVPHMRFATFLK
jgi:hypothetical protein